MTKWKLKTGLELRNLIQNGNCSKENCKTTLLEIIKEYNKIQEELELEEWFFDGEIESINDDIEMEAFDEDTVNYHLRDFYDYCDELKVFIEL